MPFGALWEGIRRVCKQRWWSMPQVRMAATTRKTAPEHLEERTAAVPDSTTVVDRVEFAAGEDILLKKDGKYYLGTVVEVDAVGEQCYIKFGDNTDSWSRFTDLVKLGAPEELTCAICKRSAPRSRNEIRACTACGQGYHQRCHQPYIPSDSEKDDACWTCSRCVGKQKVRSKRRLSGTIATSTVPKPAKQACNHQLAEPAEPVTNGVEAKRRRLRRCRNGQVNYTTTKTASKTAAVVPARPSADWQQKKPPAPQTTNASTTAPSPKPSPAKGEPGFSIHDLKNSLHSYFGAATRIQDGERFTIKAKRFGPTGKLEYLMEWEESHS